MQTQYVATSPPATDRPLKRLKSVFLWQIRTQIGGIFAHNRLFIADFLMSFVAKTCFFVDFSPSVRQFLRFFRQTDF